MPLLDGLILSVRSSSNEGALANICKDTTWTSGSRWGGGSSIHFRVGAEEKSFISYRSGNLIVVCPLELREFRLRDFLYVGI